MKSKTLSTGVIVLAIVTGSVSAGTCPGEGPCCEKNGTPGCEDSACCIAVCEINPSCCVNPWVGACVNIADFITECVDVPGCGGPSCPGTGACCEDNGTPGCTNEACCAAVCSFEPFCCNGTWDNVCAEFAKALPECAEVPGCEGGPCPGAGGDCCLAHGTPGCEDVDCCNLVCSAYPFRCCSDFIGFHWTDFCADRACELCPGLCDGSPNCGLLPCSDCDGTNDGTVGINDFLALLAQWGQVGSPCDFDGDGVGIEDFLALLADWGPCVTGACCLGDGTCNLVTGASSCDAQGGVYQGDGTDCDSVNCPQPGACCLTDGTCMELTLTNCTAAGGVLQGPGIICNIFICGACCLPDGTCIPTSPGLCETPFTNGTFQGFGSTCGQANCGACCFCDGTCSAESQADCIAAGGNHQGIGTDCASANCNPFGARCLADGTCTVGGAFGCYLGDCTTCADVECPVRECSVPCGDGGCSIECPCGQTAICVCFMGTSFCTCAGAERSQRPADGGVMGITEFLELLATWGTDPGGPPDFDTSGTVEAADFLILLGN